MSRQYNIPKSTIEDWLLFQRIDAEEYDELIKGGVPHTQIYRELRKRKGEKQQRIQLAKLDIFLKKTIVTVKQHKSKLEYTEHSKQLVDDLRKELDRLECDINIAIKKGK